MKWGGSHLSLLHRVFWNPCFKTDFRDIYSGTDALPVNWVLYSVVCSFKAIKDSAISDHWSCKLLTVL